jgi:serine protease Do
MKRRTRLLIAGLAVLAALSCKPSSPEVLPTLTPQPTLPAPSEDVPVSEPAPEPSPESAPEPDDGQERQNLIRATVQIVALIRSGGKLQSLWSGSGTILSPDGLILTNYHVAVGYDSRYQPDELGVAITVRSDEPPEPGYFAKVVAADPDLDLAVIEIATDLDGSPVDRDQLNLNYVSLGDSDLLELGDVVQVLGYPGIGGETITFTEGSVSGFTRERGVDGRAWIKTDATIAGGNSGGLATSFAGTIIGVPTQAGRGDATPDDIADCRPIADTNADGVIDDNDDCVPLGGFINALRPINLAKPLVEAARTGIAPVPTPGPGGGTQTSGAPRFYNLVFAPDATENDLPTQIVTQLPSGATSVCVFWDYEGMADGMTWEARWYLEGEYLEGASRPSGPWSGGTHGNWWNGLLNSAGLPDGTYRVELLVQGKVLAKGTISVGGTVTGDPTVTNLAFSGEFAEGGRPPDAGYLLPSGFSTVYAYFDYDNMRTGTPLSRVWYHENEQIAQGSDIWDAGASGTGWVSLSTGAEELSPGRYQIEMYVEQALVAVSGFTVAGTQTQEAIGPITFASGVDAQGNPVNPGTHFASGLEALHFVCDYTGMQDGMSLDERWLLGGQEIVTFNLTWEWGESGIYHNSIFRTNGAPLSDGQYTLELYVEGQHVQSADATIGSGTPPPTPEPPPEGLYVVGYVYDADTGAGIPGAMFIVLEPGVTIESWDFSDAQVYTSAEAGVDGYFELPLPLERGQSYSMLVVAEGYLPFGGNDVPVGNESSPHELEIQLQRE